MSKTTTPVGPETYTLMSRAERQRFFGDRSDAPRTNHGRKLRFTAYTTPTKGQTYLKPSGRRREYLVLVAQNDFARRLYMIVVAH